MDWGEHSAFVKARMERGAIVLAIGAGVNGGSLNRRRSDIVSGRGLASLLCDEMGEPYNDEPLSDVVSAYEHLQGKDALKRLLVREFRFTEPSSKLRDLFQYCWRKVYTWNYDDAIEAAASNSVQRTSVYNGLDDLVEEIPTPANLQLIYLHGRVTQLDKGFILSNEDYANALASTDHAWYRKLTQDYRTSTLIFVGTSLSEPILAAEMERASRNGVGSGGKAFLITPDKVGNLRRASLAQRGIVPIEGSLDTLVSWLLQHFGSSQLPSSIISTDKFFDAETLSRFSLDDVSAAQSITTIDKTELLGRFNRKSEYQRAAEGRSFLNGFPPSWQLASSDIPVRLSQLPDLRTKLIASVDSRRSLFVTVGQAGSGKTTATLQILLDLSREKTFDVFELSAETKSVARAIDVLKRLSSRPKLVYLPNLFVFGTQLKDDFAAARDAGITFISTARSSEWKQHFERHLVKDSSYYAFQKFDKEDYAPLIERLKAFVPSPSFVKLTPAKQTERLSKSRNQLLIALREATESKNFDDIIKDEFYGLADDDAKQLFILVGLATLARVGIDSAVAAEAYKLKPRRIEFHQALEKIRGYRCPSILGPSTREA